MTHLQRFHGIPMSKSMRGLCKEEDYAFLGKSENICKDQASGSKEDEWSARREARVHRQMEREKREEERLRQLEESRKEKEQQWRRHVAELTSSQEKTLQERLARLKKFREFQKKVLMDEAAMEDDSGHTPVDRLLTRV